ncbi:hypothetical protein ACFW1A_01235 [Kitasatospora sp. NPDC058965]|uniref:hypothetical protein n=1 Tax=Kitasatospora sp. NPDC058965 TaxID=3346682 RepID=UPI003678F0AA
MATPAPAQCGAAWSLLVRALDRLASLEEGTRDLFGADGDPVWERARRLRAAARTVPDPLPPGSLHRCDPQVWPGVRALHEALAALGDLAETRGASTAAHADLLADALRYTAWPVPVAAAAVAEFRRAVAAGRERAVHDGTRAIRRAAGAEADFAPAALAALEEVAEQLAGALGTAAQALDGEVTTYRRRLARIRAAAVEVCPGVDALRPSPVAAPDLPGQRGTVPAPVLPPGTTDRRETADRICARWRTEVDGLCGRLLDAVAAPGEYARWLDELDGLPESWQHRVREDLGESRRRARRLTGALNQIRRTESDLAAGRNRWNAAVLADGHRFSPVARELLAVFGAALTGSGAPERLRADLHALTERGGELRIPFVGPLKAGKSTLLCAVLGAAVAPHPVRPATLLATAFVPVPAPAPGGDTAPTLAVPARMRDEHRALVEELARALGSVDPGAFADRPALRHTAEHLLTRPAELRAEYRGTDDVRSVLAELSDVVRLALTVLPARQVAGAARWLPRVRVPVPGYQGQGTLLLIDTPGVDAGPTGPGASARSAAAAHTEAVLRTVLAEADGCVVTVDYTQIGSASGVRTGQLVGEFAAGLDPRAVAVVLNRVDQRGAGSSEDLDPAAAVGAAGQAHGLAADPPVLSFATNAAVGLAVQRCDAGGAAAVDAFLRLGFPFDPPGAADLPPDRLAGLLAAAREQAGTAPLRTYLLQHLDLTGLAVDRALARAGALGLARATALADDLRWAYRRALQEPC